MIVMVSTKTLSAREPDHRASTKPSEITSKRPPVEHVVHGRHDHPLDCTVGEQPRGQLDHRVPHVRHLGRGEPLGDVADRPGQREDQRRHREHREERALGGEPGDPVSQAGPDGGDHQAPQGVARPPQPGRRRGPGRCVPGVRGHGTYRNHMETSHPRAALRVVTNQAPPLVGHNVVTADLALSEAVVRHASPAVLEDLVPLGADAGSAEAREHGQLANEYPPRLTAVRPLRPPRRRGRLPPLVALADGARDRSRPRRHRLGAAARTATRTPTCAARPGSWPGRTPSPATAARSR